MTAVLGGLVAAAAWATTTVLIARVSTSGSLLVFAYRFGLYQAVLLTVPALVLLPGASVAPRDLLGGALAGVLLAAGLLTLGLALRRADVGLVAPIVSLEGVVAALLALLDGATLATISAIGIVVATLGALALGFVHMTGRSGSAVATSLAAAACFGTSLWLIGRSQLDSVVVVWLFNLTAAAVLRVILGLTEPGAAGRLRVRPALIAAAVLNALGYVAFSIGAQESVPVTAVIAAQSATAAALAGYLFLGERMSKSELVGVAMIVIGVSGVAIGA